ncbi:hypothetical protein [Deinococcus metallilatus]|uniref:Uncharacterized protein n=1 Tax=Deinococcus metallilatus TaxID=1211322 RepID=A0AAJ5JX66_9DEIO|nr:hypothetical protein [Deinococcus metallilatus]MBB5297410.1 hypothetical protein [Deinococcus metallilatus]RXJ08052.1 hypothetical protein ERJ73_19430 [Deinococcus metallilatus]TLK20818.1 hypothetical protein FCS05_19810 [Deinococcus metallilatus]GMA17028.1 hypothetical protein GCM10025871_33590 [Deinococcus metallilatus]
MSVICFGASAIKALEVAARDLFFVESGHPVEPRTFEVLHVANARAYALSYADGDLTPEAVEALRQEYRQAQADPTPYSAAELLDMLHSLTYNCQSNGGTFTLEGDEEQARRRLMQSVAFEVMIEGGPAVPVADFGNIRRVNFDLYEITTRDPREGSRSRMYLVDGNKPHPHEGFITDQPWEAFTRLWEMHDDCAAHWLEGYERDLVEQARRLGII